jgi:hypothetical protein
MSSGPIPPHLSRHSKNNRPHDGIPRLTITTLTKTEGIHDLKIDQHLTPAREVLSSAFAAGSTAFATGSSSIFRAFDGVRNDIATRLEAERTKRDGSTSGPVPIQESSSSSAGPSRFTASTSASASASASPGTASSNNPISSSAPQMADIKATLGGIGSGIGSFFGSRVASLRGGSSANSATSSGASGAGLGTGGSTAGAGAGANGPSAVEGGVGGGTERKSGGGGPPGLRPMSLMGSSTTSGRMRTPSGPGGGV